MRMKKRRLRLYGRRRNESRALIMTMNFSSKAQYWITVCIILAVLAFVFYWFEWRPAQLRIQCAGGAAAWVQSSRFLLDTQEGQSDYSFTYQRCLNERGTNN